MKEREYMAENKTYRLGDLIELCDEQNTEGKYTVDDVRGISTDKKLIDTKANMDGVMLDSYKIICKNQFAYVADTSRRGDKIALAYNTEESNFLVFSIYTIFHITHPEILNSDYLFMFFYRPEFDRYARFNSWGSARETFSWEDMCDMQITLPPLAAQQKAVAVYNALKANLAAYEQGLDDLKLVCDGFIEKLRKKNTSERIGPYIKEINEKNIGNKIILTQGVDVNLEFIPAKREAEDKEETKIVRAGQFAFNKVVKSNGTKLPIALRVGEECVISSSYVVFEICHKEKLLPEFLMLWFSRSETHRRCGYVAQGTTRDVISFEDMCDVQIPLPSLKVQQSIVNIYKCYTERRRIAAELKTKIKTICPILIKGSLENM